jgi:hypothetical protein
MIPGRVDDESFHRPTDRDPETDRLRFPPLVRVAELERGSVLRDQADDDPPTSEAHPLEDIAPYWLELQAGRQTVSSSEAIAEAACSPRQILPPRSS